ncbi:DegT/DnrJ/EryC1/StrS family aminotransferase [Methanobrevibacter sp.]|uniref:DegT/DnrJ/EryC1/StrS family aminotransferase n=1 Tax=Methanobrevibacter sp. TaxID=66852 RepID=UPI0026273810|nr:DegT/DnrJ/EryC1/StrS family aminotransferase [uncultured Methanobrevibacter sp.]
MKLLYKEPSKKTKKVMEETIKGSLDSQNQKTDDNEIKNKISSKTNHDYCEIVNSGNAAIMVAMNGIEGPIIIPDQGAWHGFKQIAKFLNKEIITIKTDLGIINQEVLDDFLEKNPSVNNNNSAIFLTSFAGYTAEQPMKEISNWSNDNNITLVEDASGGICDFEGKLANGKYSDIIIVSTSSPKVINVNDGGFITTNNKDIFEKSKLLLKVCKSNTITKKAIYTEIDFAENNLKKTIQATSYIKNNLKNVIHQDKRGTNVILANDNHHELAKNLKEEFDLGGRAFITKCPNYNRLKEKGVAIEIKNLNTEALEKENLDKIIRTIQKYQ